MKKVDCLIIGAGAAGLFCAIQAAKRGRQVLIIDHSNKPGKKILMSGGGRCNFTNLYVTPDHYLSCNPHFHKSALSQYTQWDFIHWVQQHAIAYHEKAQGQLFCNNKAKDLLSALLLDCAQAGVSIELHTSIESVTHPSEKSFVVHTSSGTLCAESLVVATGGLSIPTMGATPFAYRLAEQFSIPIIPVRAGLVPLTLAPTDLNKFKELSGVSLPANLSASGVSFLDDLLITHRGLSGPAALQISSYWQKGDLTIDWMPTKNIVDLVTQHKKADGKQLLKKHLTEHLPNRLASLLVGEAAGAMRLADFSNQQLTALAQCLHADTIKPSGTEGYRTAEVTLGGVDTHYLSSKTMQVSATPSLYFIGEAVDVTGWLGGFNFQWAWSSGWVAGQHC